MSKNIYDEIGLPSIQNNKKIIKLTEPLKLFFGIDRFWRNTHRRDGYYSVIGNCPLTANIFFEKRYYMGHPFFRDPEFFRSGHSLPELLNHNEYEKTQGKFKNEGECFHVLTVIRKHPNSFVEYGFASSEFKPGFEATYLNNMRSINRFIDFFEESASQMLQDAEEHSINIAAIIGDKYNENPNICGNIIIPDQELKFLAAIDKDERIAHALLSLTQSERRCLKHYLSGLTMKEAAKKLFISPRTVESHIGNSKCKLGIQTRSELFRVLLPYQAFL